MMWTWVVAWLSYEKAGRGGALWLAAIFTSSLLNVHLRAIHVDFFSGTTCFPPRPSPRLVCCCGCAVGVRSRPASHVMLCVGESGRWGLGAWACACCMTHAGSCTAASPSHREPWLQGPVQDRQVIGWAIPKRQA